MKIAIAPWTHRGYNFKYFRKGSFYAKVYIITKLENIILSTTYLPDGINKKSLTRDFLMTVSG